MTNDTTFNFGGKLWQDFKESGLVGKSEGEQCNRNGCKGVIAEYKHRFDTKTYHNDEYCTKCEWEASDEN